MAEIVIKLVNGELAGKTAQSIAKEINAAATAAKKAEIGTKEWVEANKKLEDAKQLQVDLKKQIEGTTDASNMLKAAWNNLPGSQYFNQVVQSFGMMKSGVGGLITQFGVLKTAIAATGIGLLVVAFATLVGWFKKTDEGATLLQGIMKGLGIVFDTVFGALIDMAKALGDFFTGKKSIKQGLIDLVDFIGTNLMNRLKSFMVIWEGIRNLDMKKVTDGFIQLGTGIENGTDKLKEFGNAIADAVNEGIELETQLDAIADRARDLAVMDAENARDVERLIERSKNVALSYEERLALLDQAGQKEIANHALQMENARALEAVRKKEIEDNLRRNITSDELSQAYADAQIARIEKEREYGVLIEQIDTRRSKLLDKQAAEIQREADLELKVQQNLAALKAQAIEDDFTRELTQLQLQTEEKIAALQGTEAQILEQKLLLKEIEAQQIVALGEKYQAIENANAQKAADQQKKIAEKAAADQKKIAEDQAKFEQQMADLENDAALSTFQLGSDLLAKDKKNADAAKAINKGIAVTEIGLQLQKEMAANAAMAAANPLNATTFGAAGAAQLLRSNTAAIIRAAIGTARVLAFGQGGYVQGPSHAEGGIPGVVRSTGQPIEFEGGEFFFSRQAVQALGVANLARINDRYTKRMETGGPVNPFPDRGPVAGGGTPFEFDYAMLARVMDQMMDKKIRTIKVQNVVTETRDAIKTVNDIQADADV